jgi:glutamate racemase
MAEKKQNPIGIFDSGLGGLTVLRDIQRLLPNEDLIYLGDSARLPYGTKSKRQITDFSFANVRFLLKKKVKAIVIACNSSSANAYYSLKRKFSIPIIDVIRPVSHYACTITHNYKVGVIGTGATIASGAYQREITKVEPQIKVFTQPCPLFVPLVEEGWLCDSVTRAVITRYLKPLMKKRIDTLILGCTHYPLLKKTIKEEIDQTVKVIDSGPTAVYMLKQKLSTQGLLNKNKTAGKLHIFVTDLSPHFIKIGERFLQQPLKNIKVVQL